MLRRLFVLTSLAAIAGVAISPRAGAEETPAAKVALPEPTPAGIELFEKRIRPLLAEHCFKCHGEKKQEGGLRLDSRAALVKGSDNGPVIDAADLAKSSLLDAINYGDNYQMPPDGKLPEPALAAFA